MIIYLLLANCSYLKKTDFLSIHMPYSDKMTSISQNIIKKACVPWKSNIKNN